ncbi:hypothetical protein [Streptomyces winkii]|uniref:hypothetical protein n=1 Tax=Streptomyces winkii TaxID=3051178 RepID=UPI0028D5BACE|nr:hypothetical protein [Streptomyces sp. DSM 40971]
MPSFGYRLFIMQVHRGRKKTPTNFNDCNGEHYQDIVERSLKALSTRTMVGKANDAPGESDSENESLHGQPALRVSDINVSDNIVQATILLGSVGSHEKALGMGDPSEDADISDKAAAKSFRVVMALPSNGLKGFLAVEDISRTCPVTPLIRWLKWQSQTDQNSASSASEGWRLTVRHIADEAHLEEMIRNGQVEKLELVKNAVNANRARSREEFRVSAPVIERGMLRRVADLVKTWMPSDDREREPVTPTDGEAAKLLAAIVGHKVEDLDVDDGWVVIKDADDRTRRVSPSRMSEFFTYKQSPDGRADTPRFYTEVRATALRLQETAEVVVDWPDI